MHTQIAKLQLSTPEAEAARQRLLQLPAAARRVGELQLERRLKGRGRGGGGAAAFSWIRMKEVALG